MTGGAGSIEDDLALLLALVQRWVGIRNGAPERIALARRLTPRDENNVCWNAARSSSKRTGGSTSTSACAKSAPRACSRNEPKRASC